MVTWNADITRFIATFCGIYADTKRLKMFWFALRCKTASQQLHRWRVKDIYIYIYILYIGRNPNERELFHINEKLKESGNISASELTLLENKKTALIAEVTGLSLGEHT